MSGWIAGIVIGLVLLAFIVSRINRRTCLKAYGQGIADAADLSWNDCVLRYRSYLFPMMRPMDAASYQRGLEFMLNSTTVDWQVIKSDFLGAYKSGEITREGTLIGQYGAELAVRNFRLRVRQDLDDLLQQQPELRPLLARASIERDAGLTLL